MNKQGLNFCLEVENYGKSRFVKIAPKITPMYMTQGMYNLPIDILIQLLIF